MTVRQIQSREFINRTELAGCLFHSFRHTFCTYLHRAGVPLREAMELMRHSDVRLTMSIYADSSLFTLRPAVEKLPWKCSQHDAQRDAQESGADGLLPSSAVTVDDGTKSEKAPINTVPKSLSVMLCHGESKTGEWSERQDLNLRRLGPKPSALAWLSYAPTTASYSHDYSHTQRFSHAKPGTMAASALVSQAKGQNGAVGVPGRLTRWTGSL
jgi:hypothetical protein